MDIFLQLNNYSFNLIKHGFFKQFFLNNTIIWEKKLSIPKIIQNIPLKRHYKKMSNVKK